jgi:hydroxymethylpyrimidine/phosphomethylpyrimidine kinase
VAVASCLIGYGEVGLWLRDQVDAGHAVLEGNVYREWIETYFSKDFLAAVNKGIGGCSSSDMIVADVPAENLERRIAEDPPSPIRTKQLAEIWHECVRLEKGFWDMSMTLSM